MTYDVKEVSKWPVNELGEIVVGNSQGTSTVASWLNSDQIPQDPVTGKVAIKFARPDTRTVAGTTDTLVLLDANKLINYTSGSATAVTVPANATVAFEVGDVVMIKQKGIGQITVAGAVGVTIHNVDSQFATKAQYAYCFLRQTETLDTWDFVGATA